MAPIGIEYDPELSNLVKKAREPLEDLVGSNVALMLHADGASVEEARDYLMRWSLSSRAARRPADRVHRPIRPGVRTCRPMRTATGSAATFVDGDPQRFKRLLTEQLTPADLV